MHNWHYFASDADHPTVEGPWPRSRWPQRDGRWWLLRSAADRLCLCYSGDPAGDLRDLVLNIGPGRAEAATVEADDECGLVMRWPGLEHFHAALERGLASLHEPQRQIVFHDFWSPDFAGIGGVLVLAVDPGRSTHELILWSRSDECWTHHHVSTQCLEALTEMASYAVQWVRPRISQPD